MTRNKRGRRPEGAHAKNARIILLTYPHLKADAETAAAAQGLSVSKYVLQLLQAALAASAVNAPESSTVADA